MCHYILPIVLPHSMLDIYMYVRMPFRPVFCFFEKHLIVILGVNVILLPCLVSIHSFMGGISLLSLF